MEVGLDLLVIMTIDVPLGRVFVDVFQREMEIGGGNLEYGRREEKRENG